MESVYSALTRDMMRGNTRGGLLMKKSATEGVFSVRVCRGEKQNLDAVGKPLRAVPLMEKSATEGVFFGGSLP